MPAPRHVALLRGINVGGKNKLPMKELVRIFEAAGVSSARTYVQSGNVVFEAAAAKVAKIGTAVQKAIADELGLTVPLVLRSAKDYAAAIARNPYVAARGVDEKELYVGFLADRPEPAAVAKLDPNRSPPDQFQVIGQEIHLRIPNGVADSKLTNAYFDKQLGTVSTFRNWRTVQALGEMLAS